MFKPSTVNAQDFRWGEQNLKQENPYLTDSLLEGSGEGSGNQLTNAY